MYHKLWYTSILAIHSRIYDSFTFPSKWCVVERMGESVCAFELRSASSFYVNSNQLLFEWEIITLELTWHSFKLWLWSMGPGYMPGDWHLPMQQWMNRFQPIDRKYKVWIENSPLSLWWSMCVCVCDSIGSDRPSICFVTIKSLNNFNVCIVCSCRTAAPHTFVQFEEF